jgi:hypothetical protein
MEEENKGFLLPGSEGLYYKLPKKPAKKDILFHDLPKKEQKWQRILVPDDNQIRFMSQAERQEVIEREMTRRIYGVWFMNNGEPTYITGDHYFFLNYWWMNADTEDGYPEYRQNHRYYFYFIDLCDNDPNCFGDIFITQKRYAKTEIGLSRIYNHATVGIHKGNVYGMQSLNDKDAKGNLFARVVRSHVRMPTILKAEDDGVKNPLSEIKLQAPLKRTTKVTGMQKKYLDNVIGFRPTVESAYQGKKPKRILLDEPPTIEQMDILLWWRTVKQQLALGPKINGKATLPATVETMKHKGAAAYQELWKLSNPEERDGNGRTLSGLYRYFQPYHMGMEGFFDEYGNPKTEDIIKFIENQYEAADEHTKIQLRRQYPPSVKHVFEVPVGNTLEQDVIQIYSDHLKEIEDNPPPCQYVMMYMDAGEQKIKQMNPKNEDEQQKYIRIYEDPRPGVKYRMGIDGTGTDKETRTNTKQKSKFAITVTKMFEGADKLNYCDVACFSALPDKTDDMYHVAYMLAIRYNIHDEFLALPEGNMGQAPAIVSYFDNRGAKKLLAKQPKYLGTDSKETQNRYCFYRNGEVMDQQIKLLNRHGRVYGRNMRDKFLIRDILRTGIDNTDLSDSFQAAILLWGDFAPDKVQKVRPVQKIKRRVVKIINGRTVYQWE